MEGLTLLASVQNELHHIETQAKEISFLLSLAKPQEISKHSIKPFKRRQLSTSEQAFALHRPVRDKKVRRLSLDLE